MYVWDQNAATAAILRDGAGNLYVYGLDLISRTDSGGNQEYELSDGLGSTTGLADGTGAVTDTYTYDVYGAVRTRTGTSPNEFTYTGEQADSSGLQYLRARYYDAGTGRFVSRDPLPLMQRYAYVGGDPVNYVDPGGTDDGKPEAVPLPAAGTDDLFLRCQMGRSECRDRIAPQQQRRRGGPLQIYLDVCHDFFTMCVRHANRGDPDTYFDFDGARQRMGALSVIDSGSRSWLSTLMQTVESIKNIRLRMPRLPNTGSGGYLTQRHPKEGGFGCSP